VHSTIPPRHLISRPKVRDRTIVFLNRTLSGNFGYSFSDSNQVRLTLRNNDSDAGIPGQTLAPASQPGSAQCAALLQLQCPLELYDRAALAPRNQRR